MTTAQAKVELKGLWVWLYSSYRKHNLIIESMFPLGFNSILFIVMVGHFQEILLLEGVLVSLEFLSLDRGFAFGSKTPKILQLWP